MRRSSRWSELDQLAVAPLVQPPYGGRVLLTVTHGNMVTPVVLAPQAALELAKVLTAAVTALGPAGVLADPGPGNVGPLSRNP